MARAAVVPEPVHLLVAAEVVEPALAVAAVELPLPAALSSFKDSPPCPWGYCSTGISSHAFSVRQCRGSR